MADDEQQAGAVGDEGVLLQRQRKEIKALQSQVQKMKHAVPKGDKKRKKEVTTQIAVLEAELDAKHEKELQNFHENQKMVSATVDDVNKLYLKDDAMAEGDQGGSGEIKGGATPKKMSKTQKRREKKAQQEREREQRIQEQERENELGVRNIEAKKLKALLAARNLGIYEIPSDGNCLYSAIDHQLCRLNSPCGVSTLRKKTGAEMRARSEYYLPFLCKTDTGDPYTEAEYEEYCVKLETTPEWGGQLEITALSHALGKPIEVIQADGPSIIVGEDLESSTILLTYHRHAYKLGEHYNSVVPISEVEQNSEDEFS